MDLELREGRALDAEQAKRDWTMCVMVAKARMLAIPSRCATELASESKPSACDALVRREVLDALNALADPTEKQFLEEVLGGADLETLVRRAVALQPEAAA